MKKTLILSSFLFLFFTAESQMIIVDVGPYVMDYDQANQDYVNLTEVITYYPDGTHSNLDFTNAPTYPIESITAFITAHLNSIISQGYKLIKIQDYNQVNSATGNINYHVLEDDFPLERTVYYFAVP
jgi:hypothetical protein